MPNSNCSLFSTNKGSLLDVLREDFPRPFSWESVWLAAVSLLLVIGLDSPAAFAGYARTFIGHSKRQIVRRPMMVRLVAGAQNCPGALSNTQYIYTESVGARLGRARPCLFSFSATQLDSAQRDKQAKQAN